MEVIFAKDFTQNINRNSWDFASSDSNSKGLRLRADANNTVVTSINYPYGPGTLGRSLIDIPYAKEWGQYNRFEIVLTFPNSPTSYSSSQAIVYMFGLIYDTQAATLNGVKLPRRLYGGYNSASAIYSTIHFVLERIGTGNNWYCYVFNKHTKDVIKKKLVISYTFSPVFSIWSSTGSDTYPYELNDSLVSALVVADSPTNTRLTNIQHKQLILEATQVEGFTNTGTDIIEDLNQSWGAVPKVKTETNTALIELKPKDPLDPSAIAYVETYVSASTEAEGLLLDVIGDTKITKAVSNQNRPYLVQGIPTIRLREQPPLITDTPLSGAGTVVSQLVVERTLSATVGTYITANSVVDDAGARWSPSRFTAATVPNGTSVVTTGAYMQTAGIYIQRDQLAPYGFDLVGSSWCMEAYSYDNAFSFGIGSSFAMKTTAAHTTAEATYIGFYLTRNPNGFYFKTGNTGTAAPTFYAFENNKPVHVIVRSVAGNSLASVLLNGVRVGDSQLRTSFAYNDVFIGGVPGHTATNTTRFNNFRFVVNDHVYHTNNFTPPTTFDPL